VGRKLRNYINATVGFPKLAAHTKIHVETLHQMFGPNGNPTARNLFEIVAYCSKRKVCSSKSGPRALLDAQTKNHSSVGRTGYFSRHEQLPGIST